MRLTGGSHVNRKESCMKHVVQNERGMALAIAIVALVIVGALIAGAFFSGTQEQRVAENVRRVQASFGVAEEGVRSEEHTSELQSPCNLVCRLLLEKKKIRGACALHRAL